MAYILIVKKAIIIHTVEDVEYCINHCLIDTNIIISTHPTPVVYLQKKYNIKSIMLSSFLDETDINSIKANVSSNFERVLNYLDTITIQTFPYKINLFTALYRYLGKHTFIGLYAFEKSLQKAIQGLELEEITLFDTLPFNLLQSKKSLVTVLPYLNIPTKITFLSSPSITQNTSIFSKYINKIINYHKFFQRYFANAIKKIVLHASLYINKQKNYDRSIYIHAPLYDLDFLPIALIKKYKLIYNFYGKTFPLYYKSQDNIKFNDNINFKNNELGIENIMTDVLIEDFTKKKQMCFSVCNNLNNLFNSMKPSLAIWGTPPVEGAKSIAYSFLHSQGVPIMGGQHGGCYITQLNELHYDSDFYNCDYYVSYGFNKGDLDRTYPNKKITNNSITILPYGSTKMINKKTLFKQERIDFLFPLTLNISMFEGGMSQLLPHILAERQYDIITFLESAKNIKSVIKPFMSANYSNCAMLPIFDTLKNVQINKRINFQEALKTYQPKAVIIEQPSTPLYEILHLDIEIFLLEDNIFPFEPDALNELLKRVHFFKNTSELLNALSKFINGTLKAKRDNTFFNHYVDKKDTKINIVKSIDAIIEGTI